MAKFTRSWPPSSMRSTSSRCTSSLGAAGERAGRASRRRRRRRRVPAARSAAISAASFTARSGPVTSTARRNATSGSARLRSSTKRAHVWSPMAATWRRADAARARPRSRPGRRSRPRAARSNTSGRSTTRGASSRGTTSDRVAVGRQHQHRQPLERHRLVAGEVRQVGADRQQQDVDAELAHARPRPSQAIGVHVRPRWRAAAVRARFGVVAGAGERAGLDVAEAEALGVRAELGELLGRPPAGDRQVLARRPQVLAEGERCRRRRCAGRRWRPRTSSAVSPMPEDDARLGEQTRRPWPGPARPASGRSRPTAAPPAAAGRPSRGCGSARRAGRRRSRRARRGRPCSRGSAPRPRVVGLRARIAAMVAAKPAAPPSARSSRATLVIDRVREAQRARPRRRPGAGSSGSSGSGWRVSTRQKPHARVQRSPMIMNVAVPSAQHS